MTKVNFDNESGKDTENLVDIYGETGRVTGFLLSFDRVQSRNQANKVMLAISMVAILFAVIFAFGMPGLSFSSGSDQPETTPASELPENQKKGEIPPVPPQ